MTDVALREYFEHRLADLDKRLVQRIDDLDRRYTQWLDLNEEAIAKAEHTMNARLQAMNEFRDALKDQSARMATRIELESLAAIVAELRRGKANLDGRLAIIAVVVTVIVNYFLRALSR